MTEEEMEKHLELLSHAADKMNTELQLKTEAALREARKENANFANQILGLEKVLDRRDAEIRELQKKYDALSKEQVDLSTKFVGMKTYAEFLEKLYNHNQPLVEE